MIYGFEFKIKFSEIIMQIYKIKKIMNAIREYCKKHGFDKIKDEDSYRRIITKDTFIEIHIQPDRVGISYKSKVMLNNNQEHYIQYVTNNSFTYDNYFIYINEGDLKVDEVITSLILKNSQRSIQKNIRNIRRRIIQWN